MPKFDVAIDFGSYYIDSIEAENKDEAKEIALKEFSKVREDFEYEICNTDVNLSDEQ